MMIIPYAELEGAIREQISQVRQKDVAFEAIHIFGTDLSALEAHDPDIIVARGITCAAVRQRFADRRVIEILITSYDITAALAQAKRRFSPDRIGLCIYDSGSLDVRSLEELSGLRIEAYNISDERDVAAAVAQGLRDGVEVFVGGLTCSEYCKARGLPHIHIKTTPSTLHATIEEAVGTAAAINQERAKLTMIQSVLNNSPDGIISVDGEGRITALNSRARNLCRIQAAENPVGKRVDIYLDKTGWRAAVEGGGVSEALLELYGALLYVQASPISVDGRPAGALLSLLAADRIQAAETKIRKELSQKGLTAKYDFSDIIGASAIMKSNISIAIRYAKADANVLLMGETGTGKELFAHSIHQASKRSGAPFVAVNCAALPETLLESELFGYVEGAFSGASKGGKAGLFELAHTGTIFLDEIGELPMPLQAKLLRVLQEKEIRRIGDDRVYPVDVRVLSATNVDIQEQIAQRQFRADLYYRLNVLGIALPPLRSRREDIPVLMEHFLRQFAEQYGKPMPEVTDGARAALQNYPWMGNAREVRNCCEKLVVLDETGRVDTHQLVQLGMTDTLAERPAEPGPAVCREDLAELLKSRKMTNEQLAKALGISRTTLWRWSKEL